MIPQHRAHILGPHLDVLELGGRNRRKVNPENVRGQQRRQRRPIPRHSQGMHRRRLRHLERRRGRHRLSGRRGRLGGRCAQPAHVRHGRGRHRRRCRTRPRPRRQGGDHRLKRRRRRLQILRQPIPGRRGHVQRARPRASEDTSRVNLRRQPREIQNHHNPKPASRLTLGQSHTCTPLWPDSRRVDHKNPHFRPTFFTNPTAVRLDLARTPTEQTTVQVSRDLPTAS